MKRIVSLLFVMPPGLMRRQVSLLKVIPSLFQFGISKKEATNAIVFLEKMGVVRRVFRTVTINGLVVNNVLYLELVVNKLREITYPDIHSNSHNLI